MKTETVNLNPIKIKTMKKQIFKTALAAVLVTSLVSCGDDDSPEIINEDEVITTLEYTLTNESDNTNVVVFRSFDPDGNGPDEPILTTTGMLRANSTYAGAVRFLNETDPQDVDNITEEVMEEALEHEVFYTSPIAGLQVNKLDNDSAGNPLGLRTTFETGAAATGNLTITLIHLPKKPNDNTVSDASSTGGEPDIEEIFSINIQ
jgi:hypothetical protein